MCYINKGHTPFIFFMEKDYNNIHRRLVIKYFWQVMSRYKLAFFTFLTTTSIALIIDVYVPLQYLKLWDVLNKNDFSFIKDARSIILFILILNIIRWLFRRVGQYINAYFQSSVMAGLRNQAFSYMIGHSNNFFSNNFGGSLTQKINKYARAFEKIMDRMVSDGLPLLFRGVGTIIAIYTLYPRYALMFSVFCVIFLATALIYTRLKLKYDVIAALSDTKTTGALADSIGNHSSIQLFTGHDYEKEKVGSIVEIQRKATFFNWFLWDTLGAIEALYLVGFEFIIFWIAIKDWEVGVIGLPVIVLLQTYLFRLVENLWSFAGITKTFYDSFADAQEMALILDTPYEIDDAKTGDSLCAFQGNISFDNVTYIYENNNSKVFDNFSIDIKAGQKVALVGSSGAGKSTFVKLLMRLFNLTNGRILIDGVDISMIPQEKLREQIGFVPQDPILFHRTLMENIRYGRRNATNEEVKEAARLSHCDDFINKLPLGFDTYVGERGVKLSGGERQRVAIARAILKNAPILVLDEATSALDSESEILIQDALNNLIKNKTTIVVAHRLSTIRKMDRIVVIEDGKIIEDGNHDDLIKKESGIYKKLWDIQAGGFSVKLGI